MALELPIILGSKGAKSSIVLYAFLQQNVLFDAFSNKLNATGDILFLFDLANIFAMIGLLVLVFSPGLWKAKYIASWVFLFFCMILGGATGPEMGYSFGGGDISFLNKPSYDENLACREEEKVNNVCPKLAKGDAVVEKVLTEVNSKKYRNNTPAKTTSLTGANGIAQKAGKGVEVGSNNEIISLKITGFFPHVLIMYVTHKLQYSLEKALYDMSERSISTKFKMLNTMLNATLPTPQLGVWSVAVDRLCGPTIRKNYNMDVPEFLSLSDGVRSNLMAAIPMMSNFKLKEVLSFVDLSNILYDKNETVIIPALASFPNYENISNADSDYLKMFTIHGKKRDTFDKFSINDFRYAFKKARQNRMADKDNNFEKYKNEFSKEQGQEDAAVVLVKYLRQNSYLSNDKKEHKDLSEEEAKLNETMRKRAEYANANKGFNRAGAQGIAVGNAAQMFAKDTTRYTTSESDYYQITNCNKLIQDFDLFYTAALDLDLNDLEKQLKVAKSTSPKAECEKTSQNPAKECAGLKSGTMDEDGIPLIFQAKRALLTMKDIENNQCQAKEGDKNKNICQQEVEKYMTFYRTYSIVNALRAANEAEAAEKSVRNNIKMGVNGMGFAVSEGFVKSLAGFAAGVKSFFLGIEAGAYSAILPIVKNILVAFVIVMTPVLYIIGLMVPAWAPGVIATSLVALIYLQMVDVVMVLMNSVLTSITRSVQGVGADEQLAYLEFMQCVWALAYMASFAITAFLMFAAGNTQKIMGAITGADGTIKKTGGEILDAGVKVAKGGAEVGVLVASGGTVAVGAGKKAMDMGTSASAALAVSNDNKWGTAFVAEHNRKADKRYEDIVDNAVDAEMGNLGQISSEARSNDKNFRAKVRAIKRGEKLAKSQGADKRTRTNKSARDRELGETIDNSSVSELLAAAHAKAVIKDNRLRANLNDVLAESLPFLKKDTDAGRDVRTLDNGGLQGVKNFSKIGKDEQGNRIKTAEKITKSHQIFSLEEGDQERFINHLSSRKGMNEKAARELFDKMFSYEYIDKNNKNIRGASLVTDDYRTVLEKNRNYNNVSNNVPGRPSSILRKKP